MSFRLKYLIVPILARWLDILTGDGTTLINHVPERIEKGVSFLNAKKRSWQREVDILYVVHPLNILDQFISAKDRPYDLVSMGFIPDYTESSDNLLEEWRNYILGYMAYREIYQ